MLGFFYGQLVRIFAKINVSHSNRLVVSVINLGAKHLVIVRVWL